MTIKGFVGSRFYFTWIISAIIILYSSTAECSDISETKETGHEQAKEKKFNAKKFLFGHISDAHEWHIFTYKDKHVSIYLPVILISRRAGLVVFSSRRFHHGQLSYHHKGYNYKLEHEGKNKGKIFEFAADGSSSTPFDISITKNIVSLFFSIILITWIFLSTASLYKKNRGKPPKGLQSFIEPIIIFVRDDIARQSIGEKQYERFTPYLLTVFFFIWINNMLGIIPIPPGGANLTGNIAVTGVLAFFTLMVTNISGNRNYWKHIFNTPGVPVWLKIPPLMPIIEIFGVFTKPIVLMIRLFANITAGHLITLGFLCVIFVFGQNSPTVGLVISPLSIVFIIFMIFLELLVAFIQAFVFTFLSALYIGMAVEEHH
jgi:F-type H+-transporting ATPase subunit a